MWMWKGGKRLFFFVCETLMMDSRIKIMKMSARKVIKGNFMKFHALKFAFVEENIIPEKNHWYLRHLIRLNCVRLKLCKSSYHKSFINDLLMLSKFLSRYTHTVYFGDRDDLRVEEILSRNISGKIFAEDQLFSNIRLSFDPNTRSFARIFLFSWISQVYEILESAQFFVINKLKNNCLIASGNIT